MGCKSVEMMLAHQARYPIILCGCRQEASLDVIYELMVKLNIFHRLVHQQTNQCLSVIQSETY